MNLTYTRSILPLVAVLALVGLAAAQPTPSGLPGTVAPGAPGSSQPSAPAAGALPETPTQAPVVPTPPPPVVYEAPPLPQLTHADTYDSLPRFGASLFRSTTSPTQATPGAPFTTAADPTLTTPGASTTPPTWADPVSRPVFYPTPSPAPSTAPASGGLSAGSPIANVPVPPEYVIGPGDVLSLTVWAKNREQIHQDFTVNAEGHIFLPQIGKLTAAGQRLADLQSTLVQTYGQYYTDPSITLVIAQQRVVEVYVTGEAARPGKYTLVGMATVFTALYAAGGPSDIGTYRNLLLTRVGKPNLTIDLYDYLLYGNRGQDVLLQPGDTLFIPPLEAEVGLSGWVRRPARYELKGPTTAEQALAMAGGLRPGAYAPRVQMWRLDAARQWQLTNLDLSRRGSQDGTTLLQDGDLLITSPALPEPSNVAYLVGAIKRPGAYPVATGTTLSAVLAAAEGPSDDAYVGLGTIRRLGEDLHYQTITFSVGDVLARKPGADLVLQPKDVVELYRQDDVEPPALVEVRGAVAKPGFYPWTAGMSVKQLVLLAGGPVPGAYLERGEIYRLRPDQRREVLALDVQASLAGRRDADPVLLRGDILEIRPRETSVPASVVHIDGLVARPGSYPRSEGMRVSDLIFAAGGLLPGAGPTVELTPGRIEGEVHSTRLQLAGDPLRYQLDPDPVLKDDDNVGVTGRGDFTVKPASALLLGQVKRPGSYAFKTPAGSDAYTVWDLLQEGQGLLADGDPAGLVVFRAGDIQTPQQAQDLARVVGGTYANSEILPAAPEAAPAAPTSFEEAKPPAASAETTTADTSGVPAGETARLASAASTLPGAADTPTAAGAPAPGEAAPGPPATTAAATPETPTSPAQPRAGQPLTLVGAASLQANQAAAMKAMVTQQVTQVLASTVAISIVTPPRPFLLDQIVTGIPLDGSALFASRGARGNFVLRDGDVVVVPRRSTVVTVLGAVARSGAVPARERGQVRDYLKAAGGLREDADAGHLVLVHANGAAVPGALDAPVGAGDVIVVPSRHVIRNIRVKGQLESWLENILPPIVSALIVASD